MTPTKEEGPPVIPYEDDPDRPPSPSPPPAEVIPAPGLAPAIGPTDPPEKGRP